jgi:hypothetical protein
MVSALARNKSGSLAMFAAILRAASCEGWKQSMGNGCSQGETEKGTCHEAFDISLGTFRGSDLCSNTRCGAKLSMVCILWTAFRRHELRIRNISTMLGHDQWGWRVLWGQSDVPAGAATISASEAPSVLRR